MNERIKQLELEAYNFANSIALPGNYTDAALSWYRRESFNKKFAELIVRECADIGHLYEGGEYEVRNQIMAHFGVEE